MSSKKILIVDDSKTSRMFIQAALEMAGFPAERFVEASNGLEAFHAMKSAGPFELLVTDINMPEKSGLELIQEIRAADMHVGLQIVVISSTQSQMRDAHLKELGVHAILEKPISMPKLMAAFSGMQAD